MTLLTVTPVTPTIGAQISGVDLRHPLDASSKRAVEDALAIHQVVFFRDQQLTIEQHKAFSASLGDLWAHPYLPRPDEHPEMLVVQAKPGATKAPGQGWHTDMSADETPPSVSILRMVSVPPSGGDTLFASMYAAYDALSEDWKRFIDPLNARHSSAGRHGGEFGLDFDHSGAVHPVVRRHPVTGRKALYVNPGFTVALQGMSNAESRAVLDFLFSHCENPEFHVRFRWEPHSIAMWDNRCVMHHAIFDYEPEQRLGYRFTLTGERPAG